MTIQEFNQLPKGQQRVVIAQDVIAQIQAEVFKPRMGYYVSLDNVNNFSHNGSVQAEYESINSCHVCAIGACLLATTKYKNKVTFRDIMGAETFRRSMNVQEVMKDVFTPKQLLLMESCFEHGMIQSSAFSKELSDDFLTEKEWIACRNFHDKYNTSNQRLIAIMENIIKNNGRFRIG